MSTPPFSIFTDETPGFAPDHAGLRFTLAIALPGARADAEKRVDDALAGAVEPWGLPYHASEVEHASHAGTWRAHLEERIRRGEWRSLLGGLRLHAPALEGHDDRALRASLEGRPGALSADVDHALRGAMAGVPGRAAAAARRVLDGGMYVLCGGHGQVVARDEWVRMMEAVVEHALLLLALEGPGRSTRRVEVVPAEAGRHASHLDLGAFLTSLEKGGLVAALDTDPRPGVVKATASSGIQLADIVARELTRRSERGGARLCHSAPVKDPESWSVAMLHHRLPESLRRAGSTAGPPHPRPPWRTPAPLEAKKAAPKAESGAPDLDGCFNACGAHETHAALRQAVGDPAKLAAIEADVRDMLARRWRVRAADGSAPAGFPFHRTLPFAAQMTLPILEELARRASAPPGDGEPWRTDGEPPSGSDEGAPDVAPPAAQGHEDDHEHRTRKDLETMEQPAARPEMPRVSSLSSATLPPDLLLPAERTALADGRDPYGWATGAGRLLRWREHARFDRDLGAALAAVRSAEAARTMGEATTILAGEIRWMARVLRGEEEGPPNAAWGLLAARDDLESVRRALIRIERECRPADTPDLAEEVEHWLAELADTLPALDAEIAALEPLLLAGLVDHPDDPHRLRLDALELSASGKEPREPFRAVLDHLVQLFYQLRANDEVLSADFEVDSFSLAHRYPDTWLFAVDIEAAVRPVKLSSADIAHVWLADCKRPMERPFYAQPRSELRVLSTAPPSNEGPEPRTGPSEPEPLPTATKAWLRARRRGP